MDKKIIGYFLIGLSGGMSILALLGYTQTDKKKYITGISGLFLIIGLILVFGFSFNLSKPKSTSVDSKEVSDL